MARILARILRGREILPTSIGEEAGVMQAIVVAIVVAIVIDVF